MLNFKHLAVVLAAIMALTMGTAQQQTRLPARCSRLTVRE